MSINGRDIKKATKEAYKRPKETNPFVGVIFDPAGQWKFPGEVTKIPGGNITMQNVPYPVLGIDNYGYQQMMMPGGNYTFPGEYVTEFPMMKGGGPSVEKAKAMLEDGTAWGHPLTQKQIDLFRSIVEEAEGESEDTGEEYRRGGQKRRRLPHNRTSQNIKTSLNFLMARNPILYGRYPHALYDPNAKMEFGGWLDKYQEGGEKPWGEMTYAEKKAYLDAKEKKKPMTKAQADAWAKKAQQKSSAQAKKEHYEDFVRESTAKTLTHPLFTAPAYFTPEGAAIGVLQSMANLPGHIKDKDYVGIGMDVLGALPGAPKTIQKTIQKTTPYAKHFAEDLPHYLPKVNLQKGKPLITFPEYENYWRVQPHGFSREKIPYNPNLTLEQNLYTGRWVETDPVGALDYVKGVQKKVGPEVDPRFDIIKGRMPKTRLEQLRGYNLPEQAKLMSYGPGKYGTWEVAYNEGAITDIEKNILTMYERHPELFTEGSLHKGHYDNVVRKIAANPDLIKTSEAILPAEKIRLANMFLKKKGLSTTQAEDLLRKAAEPQPSFLGKYKKYSPFEQGGSTGGWLDNYE